MVIGIDASRANIRQRTGTENYSWHVIREMVRLDRSATFRLYFNDDPISELAGLGPNVQYKVLRWPLGLLWSQLRLSWEMLLHGPDVLFVPAHTIPLIHPKTVTTLHDLGFERDTSLYAGAPIGGRGLKGSFIAAIVRIVSFGTYGTSELDYHRWSARYAARHAARLITVSEFTKREIIDRYGTEPQKISVIHHGIDAETFKRPTSETITALRAKYHLHRPYFVYVGRLEKKKNITLLIDTFSLLRRTYPDIELILIGKKGFGWDEAEQCLRAKSLGESVRVLGWVPYSESNALVAGAVAFMLLSEYEGFGMPILESYCLGTPVIASTNGSIPEIAGDAALLVSTKEPDTILAAMKEVLEHSSEITELVRKGNERAASFSWPACASKTYDVLREVAHAR